MSNLLEQHRCATCGRDFCREPDPPETWRVREACPSCAHAEMLTEREPIVRIVRDALAVSDRPALDPDDWRLRVRRDYRDPRGVYVSDE